MTKKRIRQLERDVALYKHALEALAFWNVQLQTTVRIQKELIARLKAKLKKQ
jgi:hypothetical protein